MMMKDKGVRPKDFTLQSKLFRKAFYENSAAIEDLAIFVEVTNSNLARKVGLTGKDQIVVVQNQNKYSTIKDGVDFKLLNLQLERSAPCNAVLDATLKEKFAEYFEEMTTQELAEQFMLSENEEVNVFSKLLAFVEANILPDENGLIFAQTQKALRFYKNYLKSKQQNLLFVSVHEPEKPQQDWLMKQCKAEMEETGTDKTFDNVYEKYQVKQDTALTEFISELKQIKQENTHSDLQVLLSDVKEAPAAFNLIQDSHQEMPKTEGKPTE